MAPTKKKIAARRRARRAGIQVTATDLLGVLREHGEQLTALREELAAARLDLRLLRQDFVRHAPTATTHEPATAGEAGHPPTVLGR